MRDPICFYCFEFLPTSNHPLIASAHSEEQGYELQLFSKKIMKCHAGIELDSYVKKGVDERNAGRMLLIR